MNYWSKRILKHIVETPEDIQTLVVRYEDIQQNATREVARMLDYLQFPYTYKTLVERLKDDFVLFHRNHTIKFETFTECQIELVEGWLNKTLNTLLIENHRITFGIEEYMRNKL